MSTEEGKVAPLATHLLKNLRKNLHLYGSRPWMIDAVTGTTVRFDEVDELSRRAASALHKLGFRHGHVLYFVTYEMAHLYVAMLAAWRLGGCVRGAFQSEVSNEYVRQMRESHAEFALVDIETAPRVQESASALEWPVRFISIGPKAVENMTSFSDLLQDDGNDCPEELDLDVNEDAVFICNTSGSTGVPKAVQHTSKSAVFCITEKRIVSAEEDLIMTAVNNFLAANFIITISFLHFGVTCVSLGVRFEKSLYFDYLSQYKPGSIFLYPFLATWFIRSSEIESADLNFLKCVIVTGSVLDITSANLFASKLPNVTLNTIYGSSECMFMTATDNSAPKYMTSFEINGKKILTTGKPIGKVQIKIVDLEKRVKRGPGERGEILIKTPSFMRGYFKPGATPFCSQIDEEGWFQTGDIGLFDSDGNLYVIERINFMFKYFMSFISPVELESVLQEHEAVEAAGVVGVPNPETTNLTRAFVVLRPGHHVSDDELKAHVAARLPSSKHLHGGVRFVTELPQNRGGKLDRVKLRDLALAED